MTIIFVMFVLLAFCRLSHRRPAAFRLSHPKPAMRSRAKPLWVAMELVRLKARFPDAGCRTLAHVFNRRHAGARMSVSKSTVALIVRKHRYAIEDERRGFRRRKPYDPPRNHTWGLDLTGKQDQNGVQHAVLGIVDHGTRLAIRLAALPNKSAWTILGYLCLAIGAFGKPLRLRTDNEACFTSRTFTWALHMVGIRHQRSELGCPWQNGRVERLFGTLKRGLDRITVGNVLQLEQVLRHFARWYNAERPHDSLNGSTPMEAWRGIDPYRRGWRVQPMKRLNAIAVRGNSV